MAKRLVPARKFMDSIANVFANAKELGEQFGLPLRSEPKEIEGPMMQIEIESPKKQIKGPKKQLPAPDDE